MSPPTPSIEVEEILRSPPTTTTQLIADEHVAAGSYRRPSLSSLTESFRNVTSVSPRSSPEEEHAKAEVVERGGRRQMLRSGTSGSITPLSAPSPDSGATSRKNSSSSSIGASSSNVGLAAATASTVDNSTQQDPGSLHASSTELKPSAHMERPALDSRTNSLRFRPTDLVSATTRPDGLLSIVSTPAAAEDLFRSPSQMSTNSDADGYFTARPGSPVEGNDMLSLSMLRTHSAKSRSALRRDRVSWSGRSYVTCASELVESELATATAASLSIDDEACFVDGEHLPSRNGVKGGKGRLYDSGLKGIDFLSLLPPELSLCIMFLLERHTDLLSASLVSKRWRALATDQSVWRHLFFSQPGWAIREDAPLVLQHQAELQRIEAKARRTAAKEEAERLRRLQEQRTSASTSSPYLDRLAALKSWRETLHIPSFPPLAGLSISGPSSKAEMDVDSGRSVGPPMSPLRSPTAATGRFGLFLSPAKPTPSTPAGARRAQEAAASASYFEAAGHVALSRQASVSSNTGSKRHSVDSTFNEVIDEEEFFAASLNWTRLYRDRYLLEQRWLRGHLPRKADKEADVSRQRGGEMVRTASSTSTGETAATTSNGIRAKKLFEPTKRFLRGHQDSVYCIRQDDGVGTGTAGKLVSGSRDRTIRVWDVETGACKHILKGHTASVLSLQYDDQILVSVSSDGQVFVWDFAAILATSSSSSSDGEAKPMEDAESGALVHEKSDRVVCVLRDHASAVLDVVFDSNWIVTGSKDTTVRVWRRSDIPLSPDTTSPPPVAWRKFSHTGPVNAVDLQGDQVVSASGEGSMYLWDLKSGEKVHMFSGHTKGLACIVFKGNTLVSGSNDQTIRVWDTKSGKCTHVLGEHHLLVRTVAYDPVRGLIVSGGYDRLIKLWHVDIASDTSQAEQPREESSRSHNTPEETQTGEGQAAQQPQQESEQEEEQEEEEKPEVARCLRDIKCHRARIFDVDFNTTRIVSASEDHLICITNYGSQGIDTSLFA
ncbi:uncharacterized protein UTRI_03783_B [Ustilago trichophora]|uniref:F-box domain-containing protein n=1 Tax=Ustilago trichophora TaxID=86804 RepID=A0A5C3E2P0_9BASI|nr:uncharacterized protein UTRI_03783_B [Ustilago trichophora]